MPLIRHLALESDLLATLAADSRLRDPQALVLLPNARAVKRLKALLMAHPGFMPTIMPLGRLDKTWLMAQAAEHGGLEALLAITPAIDDARAQLQLAEALSHAPLFDVAYQREHYFQMAHAVWQLFELVEADGKRVGDITKLAQGDVSEHWRERMRLLRFAARWWEAQDTLSSTQQRNQLAAWLVDHWRRVQPESFVVIAGSTGTQSSTLRLMQASLELAQGEVWLQGEDEAYPSGLFGRLANALPDVELIREPHTPRSAAIHHGFASHQPEPAPKHIWRLDAKDEQHEAELAAQLAHQAGGASVAIITADVSKVRRINAALKARGLVSDSALGEPLAAHMPMQCWQLIASAAAQPAEPVIWLSLLKKLGYQALAERIEDECLRGKQRREAMPSRLAGWALKAELREAEIEAMDGFLKALSPLSTLQGSVAVSELIALHRAALTALEMRPNASACDWLDALPGLFEGHGPVEVSEYAALIEQLLAQAKQFAPERDARIKLYSPIEARLMRADRIILCGLNEGDWPASGHVHPWLHPVLAAQLGLPGEMQTIDLAAHDFMACSMMGQQVCWLRSQRAGGTDQLPSRFIERFVTPRAGATVSPDIAKPGDAIQKARAVAPAPCPPLAARPSIFSISSLQLLLRDPYGFYAKLILGLRALEPINRPADAAMRGQIVHDIMEAFTQALNEGAPLEVETYHKVARERLAREPEPLVRYQWAPRIEAMAEEIITLERIRRRDGRMVLAEQTMQVTVGTWTIEGRADRVETGEKASAIIDYKTSTPPSLKDIKLGFEPQLPVLAAMLDMPCEELGYWQLSGVQGKVNASPLALEPMDIITLYEQGLRILAEHYHDETSAYFAIPQPEMAPAYLDYAHLARYDIWKES